MTDARNEHRYHASPGVILDIKILAEEAGAMALAGAARRRSQVIPLQ